jgi:enolase
VKFWIPVVFPTVEVDVYLEDGTLGRAAVPSGLQRVNMKRLSFAMAIRKGLAEKAS